MNPSAQVLFPVGVDSAAIRDHPTDRDRQVHREVVNTLRNHGIVKLNPDDLKALRDAIGDLGPDSKTLWKELLRGLGGLRRIEESPCTAPISEVVERLGERDDFHGLVRLVVAGEGAAKQHGVDDSRGSRSVAGTDVVLARTIDKAPSVRAAGRVGRFPIGTSRVEIAATLLRPLATRSTEVKALDPHLLIDYVEDKKPPAHVVWLLRTLGAAMPPQSTMWLIGNLHNTWRQANRKAHENQVAELISTVLSDRSDPLTVEVRLVQAAKTPLKNRYLWFSCGYSYDVLHNFDPLGYDPLKEEISFRRHDDVASKEAPNIAKSYDGAKHPAVVRVTRSLGTGSR